MNAAASRVNDEVPGMGDWFRAGWRGVWTNGRSERDGLAKGEKHS